MHATRTIDTESARLTVHTAGTGPLALLIHGYPLDHRMWLDQLHGPLARERTLAAVDLRGHGGSAWCGDAAHSMTTFAADVAAVIRALGGPADVVGLSMGGYVALALCAEHPKSVRSLALVDTRAAGDSEQARAGRDAAIETVVAKGRSALADAMLGKLLAPRADALLRARVRTMIEGTPAESIVADLRGLRDRPDRTALLAKLRLPALVVVGEEDAITPPAEAKAMAAAIPGASLEVVPGCAHLTPMEAPAEFARRLGAFWARSIA